MTADPTPDDLMTVNRDRLDEDQVRAWADHAEAEIDKLKMAIRLEAVALCRSNGIPDSEWRRFCYSDSVAADPTEPFDIARLAATTEENQ